jgi:hypothetical protein
VPGRRAELRHNLAFTYYKMGNLPEKVELANYPEEQGAAAQVREVESQLRANR